jgi:hypothetical protein
MYVVYGPYTRKDGRKHVVHYDGHTRRTQSYPRYLMENYLGRVLNDWEHVDHINDDFTDDRIENLQILLQAENNRKSTKPAETMWFTCSVCQGKFDIPARQFRQNQIVQGKAGPYCSKSCAGKVHN